MQEQGNSPDREQARPMRVLMVSDFYPPIIGGLERHVQTLSRELVRRGHHVAVATLWHEGSPTFEIDQGVRVHRLSGWNRALMPFYERPERHFHPTVPDPGVMAGLRRVVAHERPDIVHGRGWMLYSFLPLTAWSKAKLVVTLHDYSLVCPKKTYLYHGRLCDGPAYAKCVECATEQYGRVKSLALTTGLKLSSSLHNRVDRYIAVSGAVRSASLAGAAGRPVQVISTFVPDTVLDEAAQVGRPDFLPPDDNYIQFVGALGAFKGLNVLLEAYQGLEDVAPLVVIGTEQADTPKCFPPNVIVVKNAPHAAVMGGWAHCAVAVVPSIWPDPLPQTAIEAMAAGRPVVAAASGGLPDLVVPGETGLLVPPGDAEALRAALRSLLLDPARRERMGAAGRARAPLFTASRVIDRIEQTYRDVLAGKPAPEAALAATAS